LTPEWAAWIATLAAPLHRRSARRLAVVVAGILLARGRRTASSWWRAAGIGIRFRSYYYFLDGVGRKTTAIAADRANGGKWCQIRGQMVSDQTGV
jgi:hypothetical protein